MKYESGSLSRPGRLSLFLKLSLSILIFCVLAAVGMMSHIAASSQPAGTAGQDVHTMAGNTCATATTGVAAVDTFLTQLVRQPSGSAPSSLVGYAIYRGTATGLQAQLSNLVGIAPASATSFTDNLPKPAEGQLASFRYFYVVTALYQDGTESAQSNETSTLPRISGLAFRSKAIHLSAVNVNITAGAVLIVDGGERYTLQLSGDEFVVGKNDRSTPGNLKPKTLIQPGSSHTLIVQNPNGQVSLPATLTR